MIEQGHYEELETILLRLPEPEEAQPRPRQTFIFSATLAMEAIGSSSKKKYNKKKKKNKQKGTKGSGGSGGGEDSRLARIITQCRLRGQPFSVDLTPENGSALAAGLTERRIVCTTGEKDAHLFYLLKRHAGRTLVFCNSVDCVRRLLSVLTLLDCAPLGLHAQMQQRQRLRNLDRFRERARAVLVCTDVAARGLDIAGVANVVHYQIPRTTDAYVHRSGRTARADATGTSVLLQSPEESRAYRRIVGDLQRTHEVPAYETDLRYMPPIKRILSLASRIDKEERRMSRAGVRNRWFEKAAAEIDIELDESLLEEEEEEEEAERARRHIQDLKKRLAHVLARPIVPESARRGLVVGGGGGDSESKGRAGGGGGGGGGRKRRRGETLSGQDDSNA